MGAAEDGEEEKKAVSHGGRRFFVCFKIDFRVEDGEAVVRIRRTEFEVLIAMHRLDSVRIFGFLLVLSSILAFSSMPEKSTVAVVGSANQDLVSYTSTLPALGETVMGEQFVTLCGGKGANQARAAASMGNVHMICRVGDDVFGKALLEDLEKSGVHVNGPLSTVSNTSSGVASIVVDTKSGDNQIIVTPGANHALTASHVSEQLKEIQPSIVLTQLEILLDTALASLETGKKLGATTILNPAPVPESLDGFWEHCDLVIPNESELRKLCGYEEDAEVDEEVLAKNMLEKGVQTAVVVTLGARGAMVVAKDAETAFVAAPDELPCKNDPIEDTIGAGDGFCGALASYLAKGLSLTEAATLACGFAGMSVRRRGASYPSANELPDCLRI